MPNDPIGVTVVSGFLGSGKTTLLRRIVSDPAVGPGLAVLVNELGALGLDGDLIAAAGETAQLRTVELSSGCLCCTLVGELGPALAELARPTDGRSPPTHILIETSGAAMASEVRFQIGVAGLPIAVRPEAVVTLIDARLAPREALEHAALFEDQLRAADLLILNKVDLVDADQRQQRLQWLRELAPQAGIIESVRAAVDPALLLGLVPMGKAVPAAHQPGSHGFSSLTVVLEAPVRAAALEDLLDALAHEVFRMKGLVRTEAGLMEVHAVGDQVELTPSTSPASHVTPRLVFIAPTLRPDLEARVRAALA